MTNIETAKSPEMTFEALVEVELKYAQIAYDKVRQTLADRAALLFMDLRQLHAFSMASMVRAEFKLEALVRASKYGADAFAEFLGEALREGARANSGFDGAVKSERAMEAEIQIGYWQKFLSAEAVVGWRF